MMARLVHAMETGMDAATRRQVHRLLMVLSVCAMLGGGFCIWKTHWPVKKFCGYDFKNREWDEAPRVAHSMLGYAIIACVFRPGFRRPLARATGSTRLGSW